MPPTPSSGASPSLNETLAQLAALERWLCANLGHLSRADERRLMEAVESLVLAFRRAES